MVTQAYLKSMLNYDIELGTFTRIKNIGRCKIGDSVGCKDGRGYLITKMKGKMYSIHRLVWLYVYGKFPDNPTGLKEMYDFLYDDEFVSDLRKNAREIYNVLTGNFNRPDMYL